MVVPIHYKGRCEDLKSDLLPPGFSRTLVHCSLGDQNVSQVDVTCYDLARSVAARGGITAISDDLRSAPFSSLFDGDSLLGESFRQIFGVQGDYVTRQMVFINRIFADQEFVRLASAREALLIALVESLPNRSGILCVNPVKDLIAKYGTDDRPKGWPFEMGVYDGEHSRATEAGHLFGESYFGFIFLAHRASPVFARPFDKGILHLPVNAPRRRLTPNSEYISAIRIGGDAIGISRAFEHYTRS